MKIENERDIDDYLRTLLDLSNPSHKQLCENFKVMRCGSKKVKQKSKGKKSPTDLEPMMSKLSLNGEKVCS